VLLTGTLPFPQQSMGPLILAIQQRDPEPLPPTVPTYIQQIISRALQKDPARRFPSAAAMRTALQSPTQVSPIPAVEVVEEPTLPEVPAVAANEASVREIRVNAKDGAELIWIPPGEFQMGSDSGERHESPQHRVVLDGFWIYKCQVTVAQYRKFCADTGRFMKYTPPWGWHDEDPVVNVSWEYANAYCEWAGMSLPTEAQWEKAARGTDGRKFPWGDIWDPERCRNSVGQHQDSVAHVGSYPEGASSYGILDMAGEVWVWGGDWYGDSYYRFAQDRNPPGPFLGARRVQSGGYWGNDRIDDYSTTCRVMCDPLVRGGSIGFRCICRTDKF